MEPPSVAVVFVAVVVVIPVGAMVVVVFEAVVVVVEVIPVGAMVGGAGHSPGSATDPNSLPDNSGPKGASSNPQNRPYHK